MHILVVWLSMYQHLGFSVVKRAQLYILFKSEYLPYAHPAKSYTPLQNLAKKDGVGMNQIYEATNTTILLPALLWRVRGDTKP